MSLYSCKAIPNGGFALAKFDSDMNFQTAYEVTNATCTCPAGVRPTCKHRKRLLPAFMLRNHVDDGWMLNDENMMWHRPLTPENAPTMTDMMVAPETLDAFMEANPLPSKPETDEGPGQSPLAATTVSSPSTPQGVPPEGVGPVPFKRRV